MSASSVPGLTQTWRTMAGLSLKLDKLQQHQKTTTSITKKSHQILTCVLRVEAPFF
jgi:hypothetical protein